MDPLFSALARRQSIAVVKRNRLDEKIRDYGSLPTYWAEAETPRAVP